MNNKQLAHVWAQQTKERGQGSNFSFSGPSIYSYSTEIARFIDGIVVMIDDYPTVTTKQHLSCVRQAITHLESYTVNCRMRDLPNTWEETAPIVYKFLLDKLENKIESLKTQRSRIAWSINEISLEANHILQFREKYISLVGNLLPYKNFTFVNIARLDSKYNSNHDNQSTRVALFDHFQIDVSKKLKSEEINEKKKQEKREKEYQLSLLQESEALEKWKNGENVYRFFSATALRVKEDKIETSKGAQVPLNDAKNLYSLIKQKSSLITCARVGEFTVKEITEENLIVGCHRIPLIEVHRVAKLLNW